MTDIGTFHESDREFHSSGKVGIRLRIRLTPGSKKEGFGDIYTDGDGNQWLKANVRTVPEDGKANTALIRLLAEILGVAKSSIVHVSGHTSRLKVFEVPNTPEVDETLRKLVAI